MGGAQLWKGETETVPPRDVLAVNPVPLVRSQRALHLFCLSNQKHPRKPPPPLNAAPGGEIIEYMTEPIEWRYDRLGQWFELVFAFDKVMISSGRN